jgi:HK97 gp10 family phage protein
MKMRYESNKKAVIEAITKGQRAALEAIGVFVDGEASLRSPVDTGNLRASVTHQVNEKEKSVQIGTPVEYAPYVELGTKNMKAQPYLTPAVENNITRIRNIAAEYLKL